MVFYCKKLFVRDRDFYRIYVINSTITDGSGRKIYKFTK